MCCGVPIVDNPLQCESPWGESLVSPQEPVREVTMEETEAEGRAPRPRLIHSTPLPHND